MGHSVPAVDVDECTNLVTWSGMETESHMILCSQSHDIHMLVT